MVSYDGTVIGEVRAVSVGGQRGVGMSQLCFSMAWNIHPKRKDKFSVFGTCIWTSVAREGEGNTLMLGQAIPETAWCEESREGGPYERHLLYRLTLPSPQLLALEQLRQGGGLRFHLDVRGNCDGPDGIRTINQTVMLTANPSDWSRVATDLGADDVLLVGVHLPVKTSNRGAHAAIDLVSKANEHLVFGQYSAAVAECRRAIESLWKSAKLEQSARAARKLLSTMDERRSMTKIDRELALGEALLNFTHTAHHVGADAEPEIFSRVDAALVVATTAGLVSSLGSHPPPCARALKDVDGGPAHVVETGTSANDSSSLRARIDQALEHFRRRPANRAKTINGLRSVLDSLFKKKLGEAQLDALIKELAREKVIVEAAGKLTYHLPAA
jgi:hypothetical protein